MSQSDIVSFRVLGPFRVHMEKMRYPELIFSNPKVGQLYFHLKLPV